MNQWNEPGNEFNISPLKLKLSTTQKGKNTLLDKEESTFKLAMSRRAQFLGVTSLEESQVGTTKLPPTTQEDHTTSAEEVEFEDKRSPTPPTSQFPQPTHQAIQLVR